MNIEDGFLVLFEQYHQSPDRMDQHQHDGDHTRYAVYIKSHPADIFEHQSCSPGIKDQPKHKEDQVPGFKPAGKSFPPYAYRLEHQCGCDDGTCCWIHFFLLNNFGSHVAYLTF